MFRMFQLGMYRIPIFWSGRIYELKSGRSREPDLRINVKQHQSQNELNELVSINWKIQMSHVQEMAVVL